MPIPKLSENVVVGSATIVGFAAPFVFRLSGFANYDWDAIQDTAVICGPLCFGVASFLYNGRQKTLQNIKEEFVKAKNKISDWFQGEKGRARICDLGMSAFSMPLVILGSLTNRSGYWPHLPLVIRAHTSETFDVTGYAPLINQGLITLTGKSRPVTSGLITLGYGILRKYSQYKGNMYGPHSHYRWDSTGFLILSAAMYIGGHLLYEKISERPINSASKSVPEFKK